jgi:hypothetical protein
MNARSVADVAGPWIEPDFHSGLIECCKRYWNVPVTELPNQILATYLHQKIAMQLMIPEAHKRLQTGVDDGSELYEGELANAFAQAERGQ